MQENSVPSVPVNRPLKQSQNWRKFAVLALLLLVTAIPLTLLAAQQEQDTRQRAAETASPLTANTISLRSTPRGKVCSAGNLDVMLLIDRSGSMDGTTSTKNRTKRIVYARNAAAKFADIIGQEKTNTIAVAQFARNGGLQLSFTGNIPAAKRIIANLRTDSPSGTCVECAVLAANEEIKKRLAGKEQGSKNKKFAILLSDGNANRVRTTGNNVNNQNDLKRGREQAYNAIMAGFKRDGTVFFTIGLGGSENNDGNKWMKKIANDTGGKYYFAPDASTLEEIYQEIATSIGKVSVSGLVFDDKNANGLFEPTTDASMAGVLLTLQPASPSAQASGSANVVTVKSDPNGQYKFSDLCSDTYKLSQEEKRGYVLTVPKNPDYYVIDATQALTDFTNKNFGNTKSAPAPGGITFIFSFALHGIGIAGDNVVLRPAACQKAASTSATTKLTQCLNNQNPVRPDRTVTVALLDATQKTVGTMDGTIRYNPQKGIFEGTGTLRTSVPPAEYTFRVSTPMYLKKKFIFKEKIQPGKKYTLPVVDLTSSDVDNDNKLTILDYNMITNCYTFPDEEPTCSKESAALVDVDDNGENNEFDVNLLTRDVAVLKGD